MLNTERKTVLDSAVVFSSMAEAVFSCRENIIGNLTAFGCHHPFQGCSLLEIPTEFEDERSVQPATKRTGEHLGRDEEDRPVPVCMEQGLGTWGRSVEAVECVPVVVEAALDSRGQRTVLQNDQDFLVTKDRQWAVRQNPL